MVKHKINLIYGFRPEKEVSAIQKYAFNLNEYLNDKKYLTELVSCDFSRNGLKQEFINYVIYPKIIRKKSSGAINHVTSQEYAYLTALLPLDRLVITFHDIFPLTIDAHRVRFNYKLRINLGLKYGLKKAKIIICDSEYTKKEIQKKVNVPDEKIRVIYLGYNTQLYKPIKDRNIYKKYSIPKHKKYVLYVGSEIDRKNFLNLLKAFKLVKQKMDDLLLIKVGTSQDAPNRKKAIEYIHNQGLEKDIIFTEFVPEKDLPKFYSLADVFVFPSFAEGFGFPVLEAMACGCPVVCSDRGSLPEIGGNAVIYVNPEEITDIADKTEMLLKDPKLRKKLKLKGLKQAKKFTWGKCAKEVEKVYDAIIK